MVPGFQLIGTTMSSVWTNIFSPVFGFFGQGFEFAPVPVRVYPVQALVALIADAVGLGVG